MREIVLLGRFPHRRFCLFDSPEDERVAEEALRQTETLTFAGRRMGTLSGGCIRGTKSSLVTLQRRSSPH